MSEHIQVTGRLPEGARQSRAWVEVSQQVEGEFKVINMVDDIGKIVLRLDNVVVALEPNQWEAVLACVMSAIGPTRGLKKVPVVTKSGANDTAEVTIAEKLDAAAKVDDNGEAFGTALNDFIGALGRAK